ncbi:hypothetical protein BHE74_00008585 [Ensete ventricosum]|nr:hypothetical protein BHE74_00008585 [Ensete ventricosum]
MLVVEIAHEAAGARGPEHDLGDAQLPSSVESECHDSVGHDAGHRRRLLVKLPEDVAEGREGGSGDGLAQRRDVLRGVLVGGREPVGDGREAEARKGVEGGDGSGSDQALVVEVGVDEENQRRKVCIIYRELRRKKKITPIAFIRYCCEAIQTPSQASFECSTRRCGGRAVPSTPTSLV